MRTFRLRRIIDKRMLIATIVLSVMSIGPHPLIAQEYSEEDVKAVFLYRFAGYIDWPESAANNEDFVIAVLGADGVADKLELLLPNHPIKGRPAKLARIDSIEDLGNAQVVFIGNEYGPELRSITSSLDHRPILVVTDTQNGLAMGGMVNFLLVDRRVQFEVSLAAAESAGLKIMSELLSVARRVQPGNHGSNACGFIAPLADPGSCVMKLIASAPTELWLQRIRANRNGNADPSAVQIRMRI
jgi:hypothetical protein